ncbi:LPS export ABC transporter periplasmic protein LptC [Mucilaginibacter sp. HMF5004]|uniref:LPS export ABC transporter periplasmic protein LptC n=1 Tax=Mucilaginibacter rivuli TaxID=2857527 RepID=UPI001C602CE5|nr:LPS export ABC transporter periplasmic protein LptC [Mucilaginibacter rivuli]MBW4888602.1 LPS export ABC transporter periplasmic protein LptC [Mucilaginibacter rivuli]
MLMQAKWFAHYFLPVMLIAALLLPACENDLNQVKKISQQEANNKIDSSKVVDIIYSDSAKVKARVLTPLLLTFNTVTPPYHVMPKGVKIYFYDGKSPEPSSTVVGDSAITKNGDKIIELHGNVVVSNAKGDTFKSNELIWDQLKKILYSHQRWQLNKADGTMLNGMNFQSNETFTNKTGDDGNGVIVTKEGVGN